MAKRDYYEVLGVERSASDGDIKKAFRRLARELHPDVNAHDPTAEEKFKEAAEPYEVLSDRERRQTYGRFGHDGLRSGGFTPGPPAPAASQTSSTHFSEGGDPIRPLRRRPHLGRRSIGAVIEISLDEVLEDRRERSAFEAVGVCDRWAGRRRRARDADREPVIAARARARFVR